MRENLVALEVELKVYGKPPAPARTGKGGGGPGPPRLTGDEFIRRTFSRLEDCRGCWEWQGFKDTIGYGRLHYYQIQMSVHRVIWWIYNGQIKDGLDVCHKCNNKACARIDHLYLATHKQNLKDASRDGLIPHGEKHYLSKFSEADVLALRDKVANGARITHMVHQYGGAARSAIIGHTWKHLPMPEALRKRYPSHL